MGKDVPPDGVALSLFGPGVTMDDAVEAAAATKELLKALGEQLGVDVEWQVTAIQFQCDGCGLRRADRPGPDEGWTHHDGDDLCPPCSASRG